MDNRLYELHKIITPDGVTQFLNNGTTLSVLATPSNMGLPPVDVTAVERVGMDGTMFRTARFQEREMTIEFRSSGCSRAEYWAQRQNLLDVIRHNRGGELTYVLQRYDGQQYAIKGVVTESPFETQVDSWDEWGFTQPLTLLCSDPTFFDPVAVVPTAGSTTATELVFPITFPILFQTAGLFGTYNITYAGTYRTYPVITVTGAATRIDLFHSERNAGVYFLNSLASGSELVIDFRNRTYLQGTTDWSVYMLPTSNPSGFYLEPVSASNPTGTNTITITLTGQDGSSAVTLSYYTRYVGI